MKIPHQNVSLVFSRVVTPWNWLLCPYKGVKFSFIINLTFSLFLEHLWQSWWLFVSKKGLGGHLLSPGLLFKHLQEDDQVSEQGKFAKGSGRCPAVFSQKEALKIFTKRIGNDLCPVSSAWNMIKKKLQYRWFPLNFEKFLRTIFLGSTCFWKSTWFHYKLLLIIIQRPFIKRGLYFMLFEIKFGQIPGAYLESGRTSLVDFWKNS